MAYVLSDNITSPLGTTTEENIKSLKRGESALSTHAANELGVAEDYVASLISEEGKQSNDVLTTFERTALKSIRSALSECRGNIDLKSDRTLLIVSTTKGNVESLLDGSARPLPADSAKMIAERLGIGNDPIVVCNACISGLSALILANRLIDGGEYDNIIVCGADSPRKFIISGFQCLKAMSAHECRPFDIDRNGLNLGEAAATIILSNVRPQSEHTWLIESGAIRNDAYHLSAPHRKGEGLVQAIRHAMRSHKAGEIALINAHGTATLFNDQMESVAIERAGLSNVTLNGLKGYYGHTMGAAGVLETIISMHTVEQGYALATRGFAESGVSGRISITKTNGAVQGGKPIILKTLSGFGGCNAAALLRELGSNECVSGGTISPAAGFRHIHRVEISPNHIRVNGKEITTEDSGENLLTRIYKQKIKGYAKFYKMDMLSRLGFVASELLLDEEGAPRFTERSDRAIVLFNRISSLHTDAEYAKGITSSDAYYPSPSTFLYTLPNIVTGEIAIRNQYHGETSFYVLQKRDEKLMRKVMLSAFADDTTTSLISGWVDYENEDSYTADISLYLRE